MKIFAQFAPILAVALFASTSAIASSNHQNQPKGQHLVYYIDNNSTDTLQVTVNIDKIVTPPKGDFYVITLEKKVFEVAPKKGISHTFTLPDINYSDGTITHGISKVIDKANGAIYTPSKNVIDPLLCQDESHIPGTSAQTASLTFGNSGQLECSMPHDTVSPS